MRRSRVRRRSIETCRLRWFALAINCSSRIELIDAHGVSRVTFMRERRPRFTRGLNRESGAGVGPIPELPRSGNRERALPSHWACTQAWEAASSRQRSQTDRPPESPKTCHHCCASGATIGCRTLVGGAGGICLRAHRARTLPFRASPHFSPILLVGAESHDRLKYATEQSDARVGAACLTFFERSARSISSCLYVLRT